MDSKLKYMIEDKEVSVFDGGSGHDRIWLNAVQGSLGYKGNKGSFAGGA